MMQSHKTMIAPAPGFTARVMARIEEREQVRVRQRAMLGALVLIVAAIIVLATMIAVLVALIATFATSPSTFTSLVSVFAFIAERINVVLDALWTAMLVVTQNVDASIWVGYACVAFAVTLLWTRVAMGLGHPVTLVMRED
jgi:hypothetical protein